MSVRITKEEAQRLGVFGGKRTNKYNNKRTTYNGETYDSKAEAVYAEFLDVSRRAKNASERVVKVEKQVRYRLEVNDVLIGHYVLDFLVEYADGRIEYVDVKGVRTGVYKLKKKLMLACHGIAITER